nr:probable LRR receptor-like serine/threonine-protein kinase RFK1 isoform X1 [Tanacetum cinerariifolium]
INHYSHPEIPVHPNHFSPPGMEVQSFEEGLLIKVEEMVKRLQSTFLLHHSKPEESLRRARQDITLASEKFHRSIKAAIKEEINQEGHVDFLGVQLNQRIPNGKVKARLFWNNYCLQNGDYRINLHFAEIQYTNDTTYRNLGRRIFNIYIQGQLVKKDFNIEDEVGIGRPLVVPFNASVDLIAAFIDKIMVRNPLI